ncbi:alpha/beta-hydrolase [Hesseltinella vesiculosa]|uniref:Alpha/beta-hydrolase n=1 Tax=Hesseltinella vesiculosa TaxID=101127 RepID=A0A1X2GAJ0_9FUNG|nr:alpha/beta-hydrolase [Hesseltinella vesiculosa]
MSLAQAAPVEKGRIKVGYRGQGRQPIHLYYEKYGTGPEKVLFVMGFAAPCQAWDFQTKFLANTGQYTAVLYDNRGNGHSDSPFGLYTTSQMAADALDLMDGLGWTDCRVHLVGVSMGGMISLEIADIAPDRILSLTLTSTTARRLLPSWYVVATFAKIIFFYEPHDQLSAAMEMVYPVEWMNKVPEDPALAEQYETNREMITLTFIRHIGQSRLQPLQGSLGQISACLRHNFSDARLRRLKDTGIPILIVTGTHDNMVPAALSYRLNRVLKVAQLEVFEGSGHDIPEEQVHRYNKLLLQHFNKASSHSPPRAEAKL